MRAVLPLVVLLAASCSDEAVSLGDLGSWSVVTPPNGVAHFRGAWSRGGDDLWVLGVVPGKNDVPPVLLRREHEAWSTSPLPWVGKALWGSGIDQLWIVGSAGVAQSGAGLAPLQIPTPFWADLRAIWGTDARHVWAAGTAVMRFDESIGAFRSEPWAGDFDRILALWGSSAEDVWAVSETGSIRHRDGAGWTLQLHAGTLSLRGVWGSGANDVWVVGDGGTLLHFDGTSWSKIPSGTTKDLCGVWGSSSSDVWFVGAAGTMLHWDALGLHAHPSPTTEDLSTVFGTDARSAWAIGERVILRFRR